MAPLLKVENVSLRFGGVKALSDVSFDLHPGEILGLIGPNGAGKTTMFNCITGVVPGYKGHIRYDGRDLRHLKPHERARLRIARTFQNLELFDELSALDNLLVPLDAFSRRGVIGDLLRLPTTVLDERRAAGAGAVDAPLPEPRRLRRHAGRRPARSACSGAWRSDARSVSSRGCCCSTSRRPGSTRGRPPSWLGCSRR